MQVTGIDHVTVAVREIDAALQAYQGLLGSPPTWRGTHPGLGTQGALFSLPNAAIELVAPAPDADESEGLREHLRANGEGLITLAFCVQDATAFGEGLRAEGLRATAPEEGEARSVSGQIRRYRSVALSPRATRGLSLLGVERPDMTDLRARAAPPRASVEALDHIVVRTADADAALALYGQRLGIRLALDRTFAGTRMLFFRVGGVTLELVHDASTGERDRFYGLALRVRDLEAAHLRLREAGVVVSDLRDGNKPGTRVFSVKSGTCGVPMLFVRDPSRD